MPPNLQLKFSRQEYSKLIVNQIEVNPLSKGTRIEETESEVR